MLVYACGSEVDAMQAEKELEKEMGDAGDDAEMLDEKMWLGDDDGEQPEGTEQNKDAGTTDTKSNNKGDEDTRKLVAGDGEEQQEDDPEQPGDEDPKVCSPVTPAVADSVPSGIEQAPSLLSMSQGATGIVPHAVVQQCSALFTTIVTFPVSSVRRNGLGRVARGCRRYTSRDACFLVVRLNGVLCRMTRKARARQRSSRG